MEPEFQRPKFLASYFDAMKDGVHSTGWRAIIPAWLLLGFGAGALCVTWLPEKLWNDPTNWPVIVAMYAAMVTVNGLLLALSWSAFSRIHDLLISVPEFAIFLRRAKSFNKYLFYVDWVQAAQLAALIVAAAAMFSSIIPSIPVPFHRAILAASIGFNIYAIRYAVNAVTMMHNLVWQRAIFVEQERAAPNNVVGLNRADADNTR